MLLLFILILIFIGLTIFTLYQQNKKGYDCTEDGCKLTSNGKFKEKKNCEDSCKKQEKNSFRMNRDNSTNENKDDHIIVGKLKNQTKDEIKDHTKDEIKDDQIIYGKINDDTNDYGCVNESFSHTITDRNIEHIRDQINRKKSSTPYYATTKEAVSVLTDYDTFPYPRYFRGIAESSVPIVAEREAGWRPRHDNAYTPKIDLELSPDCVMDSVDSDIEKIYRDFGKNCSV